MGQDLRPDAEFGEDLRLWQIFDGPVSAFDVDLGPQRGLASLSAVLSSKMIT